MSSLVAVSILFIKDIRFIKRTSSLIYLLSFVLSLIIKITVLVALFSLETYTSTYLNSLNFSLKNYDDNRED
jgi:hypothetical protein